MKCPGGICPTLIYIGLFHVSNDVTVLHGGRTRHEVLLACYRKTGVHGV